MLLLKLEKKVNNYSILNRYNKFTLTLTFLLMYNPFFSKKKTIQRLFSFITEEKIKIHTQLVRDCKISEKKVSLLDLTVTEHTTAA